MNCTNKQMTDDATALARTALRFYVARNIQARIHPGNVAPGALRNVEQALEEGRAERDLILFSAGQAVAIPEDMLSDIKQTAVGLADALIKGRDTSALLQLAALMRRLPLGEFDPTLIGGLEIIAGEYAMAA